MWFKEANSGVRHDETTSMVEACADRVARRLLFMQTGVIAPDQTVALAVKRIMKRIESEFGGPDGLRRRCRPNEMTSLIERAATALRLG